MAVYENGQKRQGYSDISNINFKSSCDEDDEISANDPRLLRLARLRDSVSSGRRKAWIINQKAAHSLPAYQVLKSDEKFVLKV